VHDPRRRAFFSLTHGKDPRGCSPAFPGH
jgi:hypothetical protein